MLRTALGDDDLRVGLRIPGAEGLRDLSGRPMSDSRCPGSTGRGAGRCPLLSVGGEPVGAARLRHGDRHLARSGPAPRATRRCGPRGRGEPDPAGPGRDRGTAAAGTGPARRRTAAAGRAGHGSAGGPAATCPPATVDVRGCSTMGSPSSPPPWPSCGRSPTDCGPAAWTTAWSPRWKRWSGTLPIADRGGRRGSVSCRTTIATTAYFVAAEAVTNATTHADAQRIVVRVSAVGFQRGDQRDRRRLRRSAADARLRAGWARRSGRRSRRHA